MAPSNSSLIKINHSLDDRVFIIHCSHESSVSVTLPFFQGVPQPNLGIFVIITCTYMSKVAGFLKTSVARRVVI